jgi:uncharacterized membrane protein
MRDFAKTLSFATLHFSVGFGVTYALTGSIGIATGVALIEPAVNTVVFYLHEKAWSGQLRGLAARFRRSLMASPRPSLGMGATAMPR